MSEALILKKKHLASLEETTFIHPLNEKAIRHSKSLGDLTGLSQIGIHLVRVAPGDETTEYHNHECSDEFVYILSGRATLELDGRFHALEAGDFAGFPAKGAAHAMKNTGDHDLVYLMGGTRPDFDCCTYPKIQRRMYRIHKEREVADFDDLKKM
ncbi:cupin domain-containing protein [bacterium]|nr:cupin domain-containing protein [bacterium]